MCNRTILYIVVACATGCGDLSGPNGDYTLRTVNGQPLPVTVATCSSISCSTARVDVTSGRLSLEEPDIFVETLTTRSYPLLSTGSIVDRTQTTSGSFSRSGSSVQFTKTAAPAFSWSGTLSGATVSYTINGIAYVFRR